jgi:integrase
LKSKTAQVAQITQKETSSKLDTFLKSISRKSIRTERTYTTSLNHLSNFIKASYPDYDIDSIIDAMLQNKINVYQLLDSFISHIQSIKEGITANSISVYVAGLRSYFSYYDIDIIPSKFKRKVFLPKIPREDEQALDSSDIRKILLNCSNRRLKTYLLILASGGTRTVETLAIRNKDIDFSSTPTKIHLRKDFSKVKIGRDIFISDEATQYLKNWLEFKYNNPKHPRVKGEDDLIFAIYQTAKSPERLYQRIIREFQKVLTIVNLDERKEDGVQGRRRITLHSFRRHAKTVISDQVNSDYSEYFIGHSHSPYWTKKKSEIREIYADKIMKYLTFLDYSGLEATGKSVEARLASKDHEIAYLQKELRENKDARIETANMYQQVIERLEKLEKRET